MIEGRARPVGSITVARLLPALHRRMVGPFIFIDHMGPVEIPPGVGFDVRPHPHIGLSTVTYFLAGAKRPSRQHRAASRRNVLGDVNIMTAGPRRRALGRARIPRGARAGGLMHGIQTWLALPEANEDDAPSFAAPSRSGDAADVRARGCVLISSAFGVTSPIVHPSAPLLVDLELAAGE